jgi:phosphatidate cytidylyltransferase
MKRVLTGAVLIPLVIDLILRGPFPLMFLVAALAAELAMWEYLAMADAYGAKTARLPALGAIAFLFAATAFDEQLAAPALLFCSIVLFTVAVIRSPLPRLIPDVAFAVFGLIYVGLGLMTIPLLASREDGRPLLLFLFCVVWSGDIAALYAGRAFGRRKLAPILSPKKTWEGGAASLAASLLAAAALVYLARGLEARAIFTLAYRGPLLPWLGLAALLNVAAQAGDLFESALKRGCGVKDSGALLPGHGGVLDRIDALLLAAPALWYAQLIQQYF